MKIFCLAALAATATAATDFAFCAIINDALPGICTCVDTKSGGSPTGLQVTCDQKIQYKVPVEGTVLIDTTVSFIYALDPCGTIYKDVAAASLDVRNTHPKIDFSYDIMADEDKQIAVPDLAWSIPEAGKSKCHAAAHAAVTAIAAHHCC
jgi:hypothetical protein